MTSAHAKPQFQGWIAAIVSCASIFGLALLILAGSLATSRGLAVEALKRNFDRDSLRGLDFFIERASEPALFSMLSSIVEKKRPAKYQQDLAKVIKELDQNKPTAATQFVETVTLDDFFEIEDEPFQKEFLSQVFADLPNSVAVWSADLRSLRDLRGSSSDFERKFQALNEQYGLVASDFAEFMSLNPESRSIETGGFYTGGVLNALPRLKGLKDEIQDLPALRQELEQVGGKVTVEGEQAAEHFAKRIDELRAIATELNSGYRKLNSEESGANHELENLRKNIASRRKTLIRSFSALLIFELENRVEGI